MPQRSVAARPRSDRKVALRSENFDRRDEFPLDRIERVPGEEGCSNYVRGVAFILQDAGHALRGMDAVVHTATLHKPHVATHARQDFVDTNITGTLNLLEEARDAWEKVLERNPPDDGAW